MYEYKATVTSVYDGDTITIDLDFGCNFIWHGRKCRLFGIDTPEMRGPERDEGIVSRDALREKILGKEVTVRTHKDKSGKYGRLLVDVVLDGINLNHWLVEQGLAVEADY